MSCCEHIDDDLVFALTQVFGTRPWRHDLVLKAAREIGIARENIVLEIGCGSGETSIRLHEEMGCAVVGVDRSEENIERARWNAKAVARDGRVRFFVCDAEALPFAESEFDAIVSEAAFSVLPNKEKAVSEYGRVLKPGGKMIIDDFVVRGGAAAKLRGQDRIPCLAGAAHLETYVRLFSAHGFKKVRDEDYSSELVKMTVWICKVLYRRLCGLSGDPYAARVAEASGRNGQMTGFYKELLREANLGYVQLILEKI